MIPARRSSQVIDRRIAGELFLVPIRGSLADLRGIFALDEVAAFIWERLDGSSGVDEIARAIAAEFEVDPATAQADAEAFLTELREQGLLEDAA